MEWIEKNQVEYLGTTDDVRSYIDKAECVVLPSYREGTPKTLLEAASMSKPIVATDVPGCNNVVKDGKNGYLCRLKDPKDLADKMKKLYEQEPANRKKMGDFGRSYIKKKFKENIVIDKYLSAIEKVNN